MYLLGVLVLILDSCVRASAGGANITSGTDIVGEQIVSE